MPQVFLRTCLILWYNIGMRYAITLLAVVVMAMPGFGKRAFDLYQPIIDRCPFGPPPEDPSIPPDLVSKSSGAAGDGADAVELSKEQEELQKSVGVYAINLNQAGKVMVGFSDLSDPKAPRYHYLAVGDSKDGWLVKSADPLEKSVTLEKDSIEVTRKLGEAATPKGNAPGGAKGVPAVRPNAFANRGMGGMRGTPITGMRGRVVPGEDTMKSRRQLKREQEDAERRARIEQVEAAKKAAEETRRQREQDKAAMEAEREELRQNLQNIREEIRNATAERRRHEAEEQHPDNQGGAANAENEN